MTFSETDQLQGHGCHWLYVTLCRLRTQCSYRIRHLLGLFSPRSFRCLRPNSCQKNQTRQNGESQESQTKTTGFELCNTLQQEPELLQSWHDFHFCSENNQHCFGSGPEGSQTVLPLPAKLLSMNLAGLA